MDGTDRRVLIRLDDLDRLEGLNERHRQLMRRIEAEAEATGHYDASAAGLRDLQAQASRVRSEAASLLRRLLAEMEAPQQ